MKYAILVPLAGLAISFAACTEDAPAKKSTLLTQDSGTTPPGPPDSSTTPPNPDGGGDTDGGTAELDSSPCKLAKSTGSAACDTCQEINCCTFANACEASADCRALMVCYAACSGDASSVQTDASKEGAPCISACDAAHPASLSNAATYFTCKTNICVKDCFQ